MRKTGLIIVSTIIISVMAFWAYLRLPFSMRSKDSQRELQTATVERGTIVATVFAVGNVAPGREAKLNFPSIGTVKEVTVEVGDWVEAGQALASLDTTDLEWEVTNAELNLAVREAELAKLKAGPSQADLASAQAALEAAQAALEAIQAGPSEMEVSAARSALQAAQADYGLVKSKPDPEAIRQAELQLEHAKNSLWNAQTERDMACAVETKSTSLCDSFQAEVGNGHVEVQMAELALEMAKLPATEAELQSALAQVQRAQETLNKLLAGPDSAATASAEAEVTRAEAQLEKLKAGPSDEDLQIAEARVDQAELALQRAQENLSDATLIAPFAGVVTAVNYRVGDVARPELAGITLADLSQLEILVSVAEVDINQIQVGQEAEVILDALPERTIPGRVASIAPAARSEQGVVNYPVTVALTDNDPEIKSGMTGNVSIVVGQRENVLFVPNRAIRQSGGQRTVVILGGDQLIETPVQTGLSNDVVTEIVGELKEGDQVVLSLTTIQSGLSDGLFQGSNR